MPTLWIVMPSHLSGSSHFQMTTQVQTQNVVYAGSDSFTAFNAPANWLGSPPQPSKRVTEPENHSSLQALGLHWETHQGGCVLTHKMLILNREANK